MFRLNRYVLIFVLAGLIVTMGGRSAFAQPANDTCVNAIPLTCGQVVSGSNVGAGTDAVATCGTPSGSGGVWYRFTGTGDEIVLTTCNVGSNFDTMLRVYTGTCAGLTCVVGNDDDFTCTLSGLRSRVTWLSTNGTIYYILVLGFGGGTGNFQLSVICNAPPAPQPNDDCANAIPISEGAVTSDTRNNNVDGSASCGSSSTTSDVWFTFTPPADRLARIQTCGSSYDSVLSLHTGCPGTTANEVACADDGCGVQTFLQADVLANQQYYIRVSGKNGAAGPFTLNLQLIDATTIHGADVIYSDVSSISSYTPVGGISAFSLSSTTCNIGDENLPWGSTSPLLAMNAYRLYNGRLMQIGMSWIKNGTGAGAGSGCGLPCNGQGGGVLGAGCQDVYGSGFNGSQTILGPRSQCNAFTGAYPGPSGGSGDTIFKRLQIATSDLSAANFPGALYFVEGVYVAAMDAVNGNAYNNASYRRVLVSGGNLSPTDATQQTIPAIRAWHDYGLGVNMPDPNVVMSTIDVPSEGRFHMATKVTNLGGGQYRYDYGVFNINSHKSGGSFSVPIPTGAVVTNVGFHDVPYHSGEPFDNTDWSAVVGANSVTWSSPQTYAQNPNSNALRWGTMYNFWFEANVAPGGGNVTLGLFRPSMPDTVTAATSVPGGPCPGNCFVDVLRNGQDIEPFVDCLLGGGPNCLCADMNADGVADPGDIDGFATALLSGSPCGQ